MARSTVSSGLEFLKFPPLGLVSKLRLAGTILIAVGSVTGGPSSRDGRAFPGPHQRATDLREVLGAAAARQARRALQACLRRSSSGRTFAGYFPRGTPRRSGSSTGTCPADTGPCSPGCSSGSPRGEARSERHRRREVTPGNPAAASRSRRAASRNFRQGDLHGTGRCDAPRGIGRAGGRTAFARRRIPGRRLSGAGDPRTARGRITCSTSATRARHSPGVIGMSSLVDRERNGGTLPDIPAEVRYVRSIRSLEAAGG